MHQREVLIIALVIWLPITGVMISSMIRYRHNRLRKMLYVILMLIGVAIILAGLFYPASR